MESKKEGKDCVLWRMRNILKGQAMFIKENHYLSPRDRKEQMDTIEEIIHFFNNYDENMLILKQAYKEKNENTDRGER